MKKADFKRIFSRAAAVLLFVSLAASLAGCASSSGSSGGGKTLNVGVRSAIPGFGYLNETTGNYYGLEIDIARELASRLGYSDVEFIVARPEHRKEYLLDGTVDCVIACYSIPEEPDGDVDFSPAYYNDASVIMVENSSLFTDIDQMTGCTFGTISGSNAASQLVERLKDAGFTDGEVISSEGSYVTFDNFNIAMYETYPELDEALEGGMIDAICADGALAKIYLYSDRNIMDFVVKPQDYGVATKKGSELTGPIAEAIQDMLADGTIARLIDKWD